MKALDTPSLSSGGLDGLPREDISGKITPALLKGLESSDWKVLQMSLMLSAIGVLIVLLSLFVLNSRLA